MKPLNFQQLIKILKGNNFILSRQKGSHQIWRNKITSIIVVVPLHRKSKSIPTGTFLAIVKQSKIDKEKFKRS